METISTDDFYEIQNFKDEFTIHMNSSFEHFDKRDFKNETIENTKKAIEKLLYNMDLGIKVIAYPWGFKRILKERENYCINISGQDQREYFKKIYDLKVIKEINECINMLVFNNSFRIRIIFPLIYGSPKTDLLKFAEFNREQNKLDFKKYKNFFEGWFDEFDTAKELPIKIEPLQEIPENLIHFKNDAEKYLLLNELGIIDFLNERYPLTSSAKKGLLLAYITNTKKGKSFENILSAVYNKNTESEHYPFKERNETKVNRILADIGIEKKTTIAAIKKK